jgi:hypothetical protein
MLVEEVAPPRVGAPKAATPPGATDLPEHRNELVIVPSFGGDSDIGVEFGATVSVAHFRPGYRPYAWRMVAAAAMSVKDSTGGWRAVQQYQAVRLDFPHFFSSRVRADLRLSFLRAVDYSWYGIGNQTSSDPAPPPPGTTSANQYLEESVRLRTLVRIKTGTPFDVAFAMHSRYEIPGVYAGSKLADDVAAGYVIGDRPGFLETIAEGFIVDTRDNEFVTRRGVFYQVGVAETAGTQQHIRYGELSAVIAHYAPLAKSLVFASRMIASFEWGSIPFYDLQAGGVFDPVAIVGGYRGVRGVASGRYTGPLKLVSNDELRVTPIPRFRVLSWSLQVGMNAFFDAGRVFSEFAYPEGNDGRTLGLKYSAGGGFFFQWDQASVFRVEVAYSPSGPSGNGLPVSLYFENGLLF